MHYNNTREIWDELRHLCPTYGAHEKNGRARLSKASRDESDADRDVVSV